MQYDLLFLLNSALLGVGLAMDAFSVSLVNGLNEPHMHKSKLISIAGIFAFFQALMPMIGWICVHTILQYFKTFEILIPFIALFLLLFIGGKMLLDGLKNTDEGTKNYNISLFAIFIQGLATSIDALSVGFTIAKYNLKMAIICAIIIAVITFIICFVGLIIGKKCASKLSSKATILGGIILIIIGIEIFITGIS